METSSADATTAFKLPADLPELLSLHEQAFVEAAYLLLLGRPADPSGLEYYLARVRNGESRHCIVGELAKSDEARFRRAQTKGLEEHLQAYESRNSYVRRLMRRWRDDDFCDDDRHRLLRRQRVRSPYESALSIDPASGLAGDISDSASVDAIFEKLKRAVKG